VQRLHLSLKVSSLPFKKVSCALQNKTYRNCYTVTSEYWTVGCNKLLRMKTWQRTTQNYIICDAWIRTAYSLVTRIWAE
jgi:hypothetical protein